MNSEINFMKKGNKLHMPIYAGQHTVCCNKLSIHISVCCEHQVIHQVGFFNPYFPLIPFLMEGSSTSLRGMAVENIFYTFLV